MLVCEAMHHSVCIWFYLFVCFCKTSSFHITVNISPCSITQVPIGGLFCQTSNDSNSEQQHFVHHNSPSYHKKATLLDSQVPISHSSLKLSKKLKKLKEPWPPRVHLSQTPMDTSTGRRLAHRPKVLFPRDGRE